MDIHRATQLPNPLSTLGYEYYTQRTYVRTSKRKSARYPTPLLSTKGPFTRLRMRHACLSPTKCFPELLRQQPTPATPVAKPSRPQPTAGRVDLLPSHTTLPFSFPRVSEWRVAHSPCCFGLQIRLARLGWVGKGTGIKQMWTRGERERRRIVGLAEIGLGGFSLTGLVRGYLCL
ncbi:hypothetical protein COCSADRAFT_40883, partial [Bipolaris sorokiniana ND90Pr]